MIERLKRVTAGMSVRVLLALSAAHCLNDLLQSIVSAVYPMIKSDLGLNFAQIGIVTLVYQMAASVFQPLVGLFFDRHPISWSLPFGMCFTTAGIIVLGYAEALWTVLLAVFLVGVGSSVLHPEASRVTSLASGGKRGFAQSVFQVGGNLGGSVGPLLVALLVTPYGRHRMVLFVLISALAFYVMRPIVKWYGGYIRRMKERRDSREAHSRRPLSARATAVCFALLLVLIFSKYIYLASLTSYYTFYLIDRFGVTVSVSQVFLFIFLVSTAAGTLVGGPVGDRMGRKFVIWLSILGAAPFSLAMPHVGLVLTAILSFGAGFMLSSAFPAILLYSQELVPDKLGMVSGLFFGLAFGVAGIASAVLGEFADFYGIEAVYRFCAYMPLLGLVAFFLPDLRPRNRDLNREK